MADPEHEHPLPPRSWRRGDEPEFGRVAFFADAVYAIALTLLVLDIRIPVLHGDTDDPGAMLDAIDQILPHLVAFGVAFALLSRYWMAHHDFVGRLRAVDRRLMGLSTIYLAFVALLPFPSSLVGEYEENPVSIIVFALVLAAISGMETVLFVHAHRARLFRSPLTEEAYRWGALASLTPVIIFVATMPFALLSPTGVLISWGVLAPVSGVVINRRAPASAAATGLVSPRRLRRRGDRPG